MPRSDFRQLRALLGPQRWVESALILHADRDRVAGVEPLRQVNAEGVGAGHLLEAQRSAFGVEHALDLQVLVEVQDQRHHRLVGRQVHAGPGAQLMDVGEQLDVNLVASGMEGRLLRLRQERRSGGGD